MLALTTERQTPAHRMAVGPKLALLLAVTAGVFWPAPGMFALVLGGLVLALGGGLAALWGIFAPWWGLLRGLWPVALLLALWHGVAGTPLEGAVVLGRMAAALGAGNLFTMTTRLADLQALVLWAARPLAPLVPPRVLALAMALMVRFVPVMIDRAGALAQAWAARSPAPPRARLLAPLALGALDEADRVAEALRARGGAG